MGYLTKNTGTNTAHLCQRSSDSLLRNFHRVIALSRNITLILHELHLKSIRINEIHIFPIDLLGATMAQREAHCSKARNQRFEVAGYEREMGQARLVTREIPITAYAVVIKSKVLVVIAKVQPTSRLTMPTALASLTYTPVREGGPIEGKACVNVMNYQIQMLQMQHGVSPCSDFELHSNTSS